MQNDKPPACPAGAEYTVELQARHRQLEELSADDSAQSLGPAEVDELMELRGIFGRFCEWRGRVDRFFADQRRDAERPAQPADPDNSIGAAMRAYREGKAGKSHEVEKGQRNRPGAGYRPSAYREPGTGVERVSTAVRRNAGFVR